MIVSGTKHIVIQFPNGPHEMGKAQFNEGNTVPENLLQYVSEADKKYLKPAPKGQKPAEASE